MRTNETRVMESGCQHDDDLQYRLLCFKYLSPVGSTHPSQVSHVACLSSEDTILIVISFPGDLTAHPSQIRDHMSQDLGGCYRCECVSKRTILLMVSF